MTVCRCLIELEVPNDAASVENAVHHQAVVTDRSIEQAVELAGGMMRTK